MRPGEAQSGVYALNPCHMSLSVHNGSVLLTCEYYGTLFIFLFVATDKRGPGAMKHITGVED